jgi:hypothetical protein
VRWAPLQPGREFLENNTKTDSKIFAQVHLYCGRQKYRPWSPEIASRSRGRVYPKGIGPGGVDPGLAAAFGGGCRWVWRTDADKAEIAVRAESELEVNSGTEHGSACGWERNRQGRRAGNS